MAWKNVRPRAQFSSEKMHDLIGNQHVIVRVPCQTDGNGAELVFDARTFNQFADWIADLRSVA